jgi:NlpC/P60 family putative phage cell wall peptidase
MIQAMIQARGETIVAKNNSAICTAALTWVGTPYHHYACSKGVGVDCAMLLVGIAQELGLMPSAWTPVQYAQQWHLHQKAEMYRDILECHGAKRKSLATIVPGDILLFRWRPEQPASHAAILMPDNRIIHARAARNPKHAVVRHEPFPHAYQQRLTFAYAWPESEVRDE